MKIWEMINVIAMMEIEMCFDNQGYQYEINGGEKTFNIKELEVLEILCI